MKYKILLSLLVVSILSCSVADAQYSQQKPTIADDVQEHLDYWKPVTDWFFSPVALIMYGCAAFAFFYYLVFCNMETSIAAEKQEQKAKKKD